MRALAALLVLGLVACGQAKAKRPLVGGPAWPAVFAHRGGSGEAPENTLPALLGAYERDPRAVVEMDVRLSRDGRLVVIHDATVDRTTNGKGKVSEMTLAELQALDAGHCATPGRGRGTARKGTCHRDTGPFPFRGKGIVIPTVEQVLAALPAPAFVSLELKEPGYEAAVVAAVRKAGRLPRVFVGSEHGEVAERLRRLLPEALHYAPTGAASCWAMTAKLGTGSCAPQDVLAAPRSVAGLDLTTAGVIRGLHERGVRVVYFTVNDEEEMERIFRAGADGIFTDYPTRARQVLERLRSPGSR